MLSRISSFDWEISLVSMPLGFALAGVAATTVGSSTALIVAAFFMAVPSAAICFAPAVRAVRRGESKLARQGDLSGAS